MAPDQISVSMDFQVGIFSALLNEKVGMETLKLISCRDDHLWGFVTIALCSSSQLTTLKRTVSKISQIAKPRVPPKQAKPKSLTMSSGPENNLSGSDYAILSAASSNVDTSNLISVVQNLRTNEKEFRCSFCEYMSKSQANAKRHVELKHTGICKAFKCQTCGAESRLKADLKKHYIKVHKPCVSTCSKRCQNLQQKLWLKFKLSFFRLSRTVFFQQIHLSSFIEA